MRKLLLAGLVGLMLSGCATGIPVGAWTSMEQDRVRAFTPAALPRAPLDEQAGEPVAASALKGNRSTAVALARGLVGKNRPKIEGKAIAPDCTGVVLGVYGALGLNLLSAARPGDNGVTAIYRFARKHGRVYTGGWPLAGDIVFFKETYDQNRDGRENDGLTHVGIVDDVRGDGTITLIHRVRRGVVRTRMNLLHPDVRVDPRTGLVLNDALRPASGERAGALTGQLFAGYATVLPPAGPAHQSL